MIDLWSFELKNIYLCCYLWWQNVLLICNSFCEQNIMSVLSLPLIVLIKLLYDAGDRNISNSWIKIAHDEYFFIIWELMYCDLKFFEKYFSLLFRFIYIRSIYAYEVYSSMFVLIVRIMCVLCFCLRILLRLLYFWTSGVLTFQHHGFVVFLKIIYERNIYNQII